MSLPVPHRDLDLHLARLAREQEALRRSVTGRMQALLPGDGGWARLPEALRQPLEARIIAILEKGFATNLHAPRHAHLVSGAVGGAFGVTGALAEMPVSLILFLQAIREEAEAAGLERLDMVFFDENQVETMHEGKLTDAQDRVVSIWNSMKAAAGA